MSALPASSPLPLIVLLLFLRGPTAVLRRIWTVVVDSLDAPARWPWSHVLIKRREALTPPLANVNSSTAIVLIAWIFGVVAPLFHQRPRVILRRRAAHCTTAFLRGTTWHGVELERTSWLLTPSEIQSNICSLARLKFLSAILLTASIRAGSIRKRGVSPSFLPFMR